MLDKEACDAQRYLTIVMQYPIVANFRFHRQMEFANTLLCNLANCNVKYIHLLQESSNQTKADFKDYFTKQVSNLLPYGSRKVAKLVKRYMSELDERLHVTPLGHRLKYIDLVRYVNKHPEWRGNPVLVTNADVSVSAGFENREYMNIAVQNYTGVALSRYEAIDCGAYGEHFSGYNKRCHCGEGTDECHDSFIVTYPLPPQLEEKGFLDGIDFEFGGLWNSENVFLQRLHQYGMNLTWDCAVFKLKHHHCSQQRSNQRKDEKGKEMFLYDYPLVDLPEYGPKRMIKKDTDTILSFKLE